MFVSKTAIYQSRDGWRLESESHAAGDGLEAAALAITNTEYKIRDKRNLKREREREEEKRAATSISRDCCLFPALYL